MKFVSYMLYVLFLLLIRSYAHKRVIFVKNASFNHGYITCLYVPLYLVGDACAQIVAILLVYVSILACCSALCIFEKHMLVFVLDSCNTNKGEESTQFMFPGGVCIEERNSGKCICSGGACIHAFGSSFSPEF
jgi:hypothetical protein